MSAADSNQGERVATIEADSTKHVHTSSVPKFALTNNGPNNVYFRDAPEPGNLQRDGLQRIGEIEMEVGDTFQLPDGKSKFELQCLAAQSAKLWYSPIRT